MEKTSRIGKNPVENDLYQGDVFYVSCIASKKQLESFYHDLKDRYQCLFSKDIYSQDWWLEILPKKATKAHAILQLKDYLNSEKRPNHESSCSELLGKCR